MAATVLREWQHAGDSFELTERGKKLSAKGRRVRLYAFAAALLDIPEQHLGDGTNERPAWFQLDKEPHKCYLRTGQNRRGRFQGGKAEDD